MRESREKEEDAFGWRLRRVGRLCQRWERSRGRSRETPMSRERSFRDQIVHTLVPSSSRSRNPSLIVLDSQGLSDACRTIRRWISRVLSFLWGATAVSYNRRSPAPQPVDFPGHRPSAALGGDRSKSGKSALLHRCGYSCGERFDQQSTRGSTWKPIRPQRVGTSFASRSEQGSLPSPGGPGSRACPLNLSTRASSVSSPPAKSISAG